jgi:DinB superfamily
LSYILSLRQLKYKRIMNVQKYQERWHKVAEKWMNSLDSYSEEQLYKKPSELEWSIGQVYVHLLKSSQFFHLAQVKKCLESDENSKESKKMPGKISFFLGSFPPIKIKVPPSPQYTPSQPTSRQELKDLYISLKKDMDEMAKAVNSTNKSGKTEHPAFGFCNAKEWYQMVEMHFRHHLRQKERIDQFLKNE